MHHDRKRDERSREDNPNEDQTRTENRQWEDASPDDLESDTTGPQEDSGRGDESPDDFDLGSDKS